MNKTIIERVDDVTHLDSSRAVATPTLPKSIKIEVTSRCNFHCSYCAANSGLRKTGDMDRMLYNKVVTEAVQSGIKEIGLFLLGEPFMRKDIAELIQYAKLTGAEYVFITTNGSLCNKDNLLPCIEAGLDSIKFSINAPRSGYEKMHSVPTAMYDRVVENIKWLYHYKIEKGLTRPRTCVSSIYMGEHHSDLMELENEIKPFVDDFYYLPLYSQAGYGSLKTDNGGNPGRLENRVPTIPCWGLFNCARVTWDGHLTACCFDHTGHFKVADLKSERLQDAWNNFKFVALRQEHLENRINDVVCKACLGIDALKGGDK